MTNFILKAIRVNKRRLKWDKCKWIFSINKESGGKLEFVKPVIPPPNPFKTIQG